MTDGRARACIPITAIPPYQNPKSELYAPIRVACCLPCSLPLLFSFSINFSQEEAPISRMEPSSSSNVPYLR